MDILLNKYKELVSQIVRYKSISTDISYKADVAACASKIDHIFFDHGFDVKVINGYGNPIILADYKLDNKAPTVLIYGHYDVQPAEELTEWSQNPFELLETADHFIARGVADNKGQVSIHIASIFELIRLNKLGYNIKFILEGDEASGSGKLDQFIINHKDQLACDFFVASDGLLYDGLPMFEKSFRGAVNLTLKFKTAKQPLHSGTYGGIAPNALEELAKAITLLQSGHSENQSEILSWLGESINAFNFEGYESQDASKFAKDSEVNTIFDTQLDHEIRSTLLTSLETTGLQAGYNGHGYQNSIPNYANAKLNFRLRPDLDVEIFKTRFETKLKQIVPDYVEYSITYDDSFKGSIISTNNPYYKTIKGIATEVYGSVPHTKGNGAIIPAVVDLENILRAPGVIFGLASENCLMHGNDENMLITDVAKALELSTKIFEAR